MLQFGIEVMPMNTNYRMYWCCFLKYKLMNIIVAVCISAEMNQLMIIHSSCLTVPTYNIWYVSAIDVRWSCCVHDWIYFEDALLDEVKGSCPILHFGFLTLRGVQHEILVPTFLLAVRAQW
jgi:hypothetical protein